MNVTATMTSKGQITIPKVIRDFFDLKTRDTLVFSISRKKIIAKPVKNDYMSLRGCLKVPKHLQGKSWEEIMDKTKEIVAAKIAKQGLE